MEVRKARMGIPSSVAKGRSKMKYGIDFRYSDSLRTMAEFTKAMSQVAKVARMTNKSVRMLINNMCSWDLEDPVEFNFPQYEGYRVGGWHRLRLEMGQ